MGTILDRYAVVGNPIAHSLSPAIHAEFARQLNEPLFYDRLLAPLDEFAATVLAFKEDGGKGLNVTLPFKEQARQLADICTERALIAGAVNTLRFNSDGSTLGDITDGVGFVRDYCTNRGGVIHDKRIAILGAGGAVRGVLSDILAHEPAEIAIVNRNRERAAAVAAVFPSARIQVIAYNELKDGRFDIMLNGTSASLHGELPALPPRALAPGGDCYDMVYARAPTPFMVWARGQEAALIADGLGMLVEQAAESFLLWRGMRPETAPVIAMLRSV